MASKIKVDQIEGSSGSTITVPTGQTFTITDGLAIGSLPTVTVAKGGTNLTSFAAGDLLYATGSTTLAKLAKGTASQILKMNSGATAPEWGTDEGGVWKLLKTRTASSSATLTFIHGTDGVVFDTTYKIYKFYYQVHASSDTNKLGMDFTSDGTNYGTYYKTSTHMRNGKSEGGSDGNSFTASQGLANSTGVQYLHEDLGADDDQPCTGWVTLYNPCEATYHKHYFAESLISHASDYAYLHDFRGFSLLFILFICFLLFIDFC